ncbi:MAG: hypothetical protein Ta2E_02300 [Mycoplasmoidaceae bacterium]|nr:MAG: hypothetical protein Ta2E_02300 [Mycoplasmoidaceae bacterium]
MSTTSDIQLSNKIKKTIEKSAYCISFLFLIISTILMIATGCSTREEGIAYGFWDVFPKRYELNPKAAITISLYIFSGLTGILSIAMSKKIKNKINILLLISLLLSMISLIIICGAVPGDEKSIYTSTKVGLSYIGIIALILLSISLLCGCASAILYILKITKKMKKQTA